MHENLLPAAAVVSISCTDCPRLTFHPCSVPLSLAEQRVRNKHSISPPPPVLTSGSEPVYPSNPLSFLLSSQTPCLKAGSTPRSAGEGVVACDKGELELRVSQGSRNDPQPPQSLRDCWPTDGYVHDVQTQMLQMFCREKTQLPGRPPAKLKERESKSLHALQKMRVTQPFYDNLTALADHILYQI